MSNAKQAEVGGRSSAAGPCARLGAEVDNLLRGFVPSEEVRRHFTNARVEVLKGLRTIIDERIERLSSEHTKGVSITIE